jgi:hypothetical protein
VTAAVRGGHTAGVCSRMSYGLRARRPCLERDAAAPVCAATCIAWEWHADGPYFDLYLVSAGSLLGLLVTALVETLVRNAVEC